MIIFYLEIKLLFYHSRSLKERRSIVQSLKEQMKKKFNIAIAEHSDQNNYRETMLSIVSVSDNKALLERTSSNIIAFFDKMPEFETIIVHHEYL